MWETWQALYNPEEHWRGPVKVLGFKRRQHEAGRPATSPGATSSYLAHHPATARRIAQQARREVRPRRPVGRRWSTGWPRSTSSNDTEIVPVLRALVALARVPARPRALKVRDPGEDIVATYRAARHPDGQAARPTTPPSTRCSGRPAASASTRSAGRAPTGSRSTTRRGPRPARLMASLSVHYTLSGGWWPTEGVHYRAPARTGCPRCRDPVRRPRRPPVPRRSCTGADRRPPAAGLLRGRRRQAAARWIDPEHGVVAVGHAAGCSPPSSTPPTS